MNWTVGIGARDLSHDKPPFLEDLVRKAPKFLLKIPKVFPSGAIVAEATPLYQHFCCHRLVEPLQASIEDLFQFGMKRAIKVHWRKVRSRNDGITKLFLEAGDMENRMNP